MKSAKSPSPASPNKPKLNGMDSNKALPVYSDFSHMTSAAGIGGISFAVGLREKNSDDMIYRVFPMTKIVPVQEKVKVVPKKKEKKEEAKHCTRPDCTARKEKCGELQDENKHLRLKLKALRDKIETTKNKIILAEKSVLMAEEKNDTITGQIEDAQARIEQTELDVAKTEVFNQALRKQLDVINQEIIDFKEETEEKYNKIREILDNKTERKVVFSSNPRHRDSQLANEVSVLKFPDEEDDSD